MVKRGAIVLLAFVAVSLVLISGVYAAEGDEDIVNWNLAFDDGGGYMDYARSVAVDSLDNVYVVGSGYHLINTTSRHDWWIKKFLSNGTENTVNWNKRFDGTGDADIAYDVTVDNNDNVYVVGYGRNLGGAIYTDWWIKKFYLNGSAAWEKKLNLGQDDGAKAVVVDSNNYVYVAGYKNSPNSDWAIKKFDSAGNEITSGWDKSFSASGTTNDIIFDIEVDSNDNLFAVGYYGESSGVIKKFNSSGSEDTINWNKLVQAGQSSGFLSITIDSNNDIYVGGYGWNQVSANSFGDWWIKKYYSNGTEDDKHWNKFYDHKNENERLYKLAVDNNDNIYATGYGINLVSLTSALDWWIKKFNSTAGQDTSSWNKTISSGTFGHDFASGIAVDSNNNVYVAGTGYNLVSGTGQDWWIKKFEGGSTSGMIVASFLFFPPLTSDSPSELSLTSGETAGFSLKDENHSLAVGEVGNNGANITVSSNPINFILFVGENKELDVDEDGILDVDVKLNEIVNNKANISIRLVIHNSENETSSDVNESEVIINDTLNNETEINDSTSDENSTIDNNSSVEDENSTSENNETSKKEIKKIIKEEIKETKLEIKENRQEIKELNKEKKGADKSEKKEIKNQIGAVREIIILLKENIKDLRENLTILR